MTQVSLYDITAQELEKIADDNDLYVAEIVEMLLKYVDEMKKELDLI